MNSRPILSCAAAGLCAACCAGTFTVKETMSGAIDWTDPGAYDENAAPTGAGDTVSLHTGWITGVGNQQVALSDSDSASLALLKKVDLINLPYGTRLTFRCDGNVEFPTSIKGDSGTLVKTGGGELHLTSHTPTPSGANQIYYDLQVQLDIQEGSLRLPVSTDAKAYTHAYSNVRIASGATLYPVLNGTTQCASLNGAGNIVSQRESGAADILLAGHDTRTNDFTGKITGLINLTLTGPLSRLTGMESTFSGGTQARNHTQNGGRLEVPKIGSDGEPSPMGSGNFVVGTKGAWLTYTGTGDEVTDKLFYVLYSPFYMDAGAHGGLTFTGKWTPYSSNTSLIKIYLTGSNEVPCTVRGTVTTIQDKNDASVQYPYYITKQGTGTWRFEQTEHRSKANSPQGVFAVEQGTLEFNTVSNAGTYCALGYATELFRREADSPSAANAKVGYAWLLGGTNETGAATEGRMVYTGTATVQITNRPLALATSGAFGTTQARIRLFDVRTEGAGAKTLALESPAGITNDLCDVAGTAEAPVGIVKRGAGAWHIGGSVALDGPIDVEGGELLVENRPQGSAYTWYRLTIKETAASCPRYKDFTRPDGVVTNFNSNDNYVMIGEFALFDENGARINLGITDAPSPLDIGPGQVHVAERTIDYWPNPDAASPCCMFDNIKPTANNNYVGGMRMYSKQQIQLDSPSTWLPVIFRITNGTARAVSCDFVYSGTTSSDLGWGRRLPTAMSLEASNDGVHWESVWSDDALSIPNLEEDGYDYRWASNGDAWWANYSTARQASSGKSFAFSQTGMLRAAPSLASIPRLSVAAGATFRVVGDASAPAPVVSAITVDGTSGAGTALGVSFAATGTLDVTSPADGQTVSLPLGFAGAEGAGNLRNWTVTIDGASPVKRTCHVSPDGSMLTVAQVGTMFIIR